MLKAIIPDRQDLEKVRLWRNSDISFLRTPFELTKEMQEDFYLKEICNSEGKHHYWSFYNDRKFVGFGGLCYIDRVNRRAEISLIVNPKYQKKGYGKEIVDLLIEKAFAIENLNTIFGECYECNPALRFWEKIIKNKNAYWTLMPKTKFWNGQYYNSLFFVFNNISA